MPGRGAGRGRSGRQPLARPPRGRSAEAKHSLPAPGSAVLVLGAEERSVAHRDTFLPTWAQVRPAASACAPAGSRGNPRCPHEHANAVWRPHCSSALRKQSQFRSCHFRQHRRTWGAVHAAIASIPIQARPAWGLVTGPSVSEPVSA